MEISAIITHIEALIFASDKPLTTLELTELLNNSFEDLGEKIILDQVESSLEAITDYNLGYSQADTAARLKSKRGLRVSPSTIASWLE